jgi:quercetin dioxygenase-like cupin family protein
MNGMNTDNFKETAERDGFEMDRPFDLSPNKKNAEHTHPFDARVMVVAGEITITSAGNSKTYGPGGICDMAAETPHTESVGPEGVTLLVGRR